MIEKTLANCKPSEFLVQSNKIRKRAKAWLDDTHVMEIRKRLPFIPDGTSEDERQRLLREQAQKNLDAIFDAVLEEYPQETLEVMALCCFIDPEHADDCTTSDYLVAVSQLLADEGVRSFFITLMQLA